ncbi:MAG: YidC/Oxa1 family membrane protein insertase, partial [Sphingomonadales bacterium]
MKEDQKNFLLFAVLAAAILFGWPTIAAWVFPTQNPAPTRVENGKTVAVPDPAAGPVAAAPKAIRDRALVIKESPRVAIDTPTLKGSINLKGARIDDLVLAKYPETIAKGAAPIRLLSPSGTQDAYFAEFGWSDNGLKPPSADTVWQANGTVLSPGKPVTLSAANGQGQVFRIELSIDDNYMFSIRQTVANTGTGVIPVAPYGLVHRNGVFKEPDGWTVHIGPMSVHNGAADYDVNFSHVDEGEKGFRSNGAWLGFTDKYWLTALVPDQTATVDGKFRSASSKAYQADYTRAPQLLQPGQKISHTSRFFAGAKETALLDKYEEAGEESAGVADLLAGLKQLRGTGV